MKYILWLLLTAAPAGAQGNIQYVREVALSTNTITQTVNLCDTSGAADITAATSSGTLAGSFAIEVFNIAASTVTVCCGQDIMLSTNTNSAWYGREIAAGVGVMYAVPPSTRKTYCMTKNASGCTRVTVTQFK